MSESFRRDWYTVKVLGSYEDCKGEIEARKAKMDIQDITAATGAYLVSSMMCLPAGVDPERTGMAGEMLAITMP